MLDHMILNAAILNGALEIVPHSLAAMAIIPLQMRLVYQIGSIYGYQLDSGHVKEFLATAGIGLTSQVLKGSRAGWWAGLPAGSLVDCLGRTDQGSNRFGLRIRLHLRLGTSGENLLRQRSKSPARPS